jgi:hypothetical protein
MLHVFEDPGGILQQVLAGLGQSRPAAQPVEKATFEFVFQRFDRVADSRLRKE